MPNPRPDSSNPTYSLDSWEATSLQFDNPIMINPQLQTNVPGGSRAALIELDATGHTGCRAKCLPLRIKLTQRPQHKTLPLRAEQHRMAIP